MPHDQQSIEQTATPSAAKFLDASNRWARSAFGLNGYIRLAFGVAACIWHRSNDRVIFCWRRSKDGRRVSVTFFPGGALDFAVILTRLFAF